MSLFSPTLKRRNSAAALLACSTRLGLIAGLFTSVLTSPIAASELIPSSRLVDWTPGTSVGVPGGIEQYVASRTTLIDVTKQPYNADKTGTTDSASAINAAIAAAAPGQVVFIPAGIYVVKNTIATGYKKHITIRGEGASTVIKPVGSAMALYVGGESDYAWDFPNMKISSDLKKGDTTIPLGDTSAFSVGNLVSISILNSTDAALPIIHTSGHERVRSQKSRIVSKTNSSITIFPALHYDMPNKLVPLISRSARVAEFIGIEDLAIDFTESTSTFGVKIKQSYACWFLNVKVSDVPNRHVYLSDSVQCEIRRSTFLRRRGDGSNGAGLLFQTASACLIEDNIIAGVSALIQINFGASGNVFAYNFLYDSRLNGGSGAGLKPNHGPHNSYNLFEGNIAPNVQSDGYFGGSSDDTLFRNWFHGTNPGGLKSYTVSLNRLTRNYSIIGNIIGTPSQQDGGYALRYPNMGNGSSNGTAQPSKGTWWGDMNIYGTLTSRYSDSTGTITFPSGTTTPAGSTSTFWTQGTSSRANFSLKEEANNIFSISGGSGSALPTVGTVMQFWKGPAGFQERDMDVEATTILKANFIVKGAGGAIPEFEKMTDPLPASLFRSTKPSWFGSLPWPVMEHSSTFPTFESIPAGYRYIHESNPEPAPSSKPSNVRINIRS